MNIWHLNWLWKSLIFKGSVSKSPTLIIEFQLTHWEITKQSPHLYPPDNETVKKIERIQLILKKPYPFTAPKVSPLIKCLCIKKNIMTGGSAAMTEPAEIKL